MESFDVHHHKVSAGEPLGTNKSSLRSSDTLATYIKSPLQLTALISRDIRQCYLPQVCCVSRRFTILADANNTASLEPTSPRSVDACLHLGIEPSELKFIAQSHFLKNLGDKDLAELAFKHHETIRQVVTPIL